MGKRLLPYIMSLFLIHIVACDDGRIYEEETLMEQEGGSVRLTGQLKGQASWAEGYSVVLAGFSEDSEYAKTAKGITTDEEGNMDILLAGIPGDVTRIEVCAINRLRKRIVSFYTYNYIEQEDTLYLDAGTLNAGMYHSIQSELFDRTCTSCHGGSTSAAAGLYLTEGRSYDALVNVPADKSEDSLCFVKPYDSGKSFLHSVLNSDISADWGMDHIDMVTSTDLLSLLDDWIDNGAKEDE